MMYGINSIDPGKENNFKKYFRGKKFLSNYI